MQAWLKKITDWLKPPEHFDDYIDDTEQQPEERDPYRTYAYHELDDTSASENEVQESHEQEIAEPTDMELSVDVFQHGNEIVVRAFVPGVLPSQLDITLSREMVTIADNRPEEKETDDPEDYFYRELQWGSFSRTILLPEEIDVEAASANESHGVLTIRMPKINKAKKTKLKVRAGRA